MEELNQLSILQLRQLAKQKDIKNTSKMNKDELIQAILGIASDNSKKELEQEKSDDIEYKLKDEGEILPNNKDDFYVEGVLEVLPDGYGFIRGDNYLSTPKDVYVSPVQIRRFRLDTGDKLRGIARKAKEGEKFPALIYVNVVNGDNPEVAMKRESM